METTFIAVCLNRSYQRDDGGLSGSLMYECELSEIVIFFIFVDLLFLALLGLLHGLGLALLDEVEDVALLALRQSILPLL